MTDIANKGLSVESLSAVYQAADILVRPPFKVYEVITFLQALADIVMEAEEIEDKKQILFDIWEWADEKYDLVARLDGMIRVGWILESVDGPAIRYAIEKVILPGLAEQIEDLC